MTTTITADNSGRATQRGELRAFLTTRRSQVTPESAGIAGGSRRRTPGLRREEVAVLAGVGVSWYQWLEQGRDITVSAQVLDSVARVLLLNESERRHLYVLAGLNPPLAIGRDESPVAAELMRLVEGWMPNPAHLLDRYWNLIATNRAAQLVLGYGADEHDNCLASFFLDPMYRTSYPHWAEMGRALAAQYRTAMSEHPGDDGFALVVRDLEKHSPEFAEFWNLHEAQPTTAFTKVLNHPVVGELVFESTQLQVPGRSDLFLVFHDPHTDTDTPAKLADLLRRPSSPVAQRT